MAEEKPKSKGNDANSHQQTPFWEWIIAAIGLFLVIGAVSTAIYRPLTDDPTPPNLIFSVDSVEPSGGRYLVKFSVTNTGSQTAAGVNIEGVLKTGTEDAETATATLTYAPSDSVRYGGLFFKKNPMEYNLEIRALGYEKP